MPKRREPGAGPGAGTGTGTAAGTGALRGLVGAGPSQVGIVGALRARDVSRPTPEDVVRAVAKPEPTARPTIHQDAPQEAAAQEAAPQEAAESGNGGGTSV
ncbi:MAG TPA: hypothetical protein VIJ31_02365, partial [Acidothermaceae bacterium]